jgi:anti-sigma B factor antagonist
VNPEKGNPDGVQIGEIDLEQTESGIAIISISGEHDLNTAPQLRQRVEEQIDAGNAVVIDLTKASFVDSSILGVILEGARRSTDTGIGFAVAQAGGAMAVRRVLDVTGLRAELPVHPSREDALQAAARALDGGGS